jgi:HK97 gp10 family phage protein
MPRPEIRVEGLAELRRALRQVDDPEALGELRRGLKDAAEIVARDARSRVPVRTGRARDSIRATSGGNKAYVIGGKARVPYYGWLDFGTRTPRRGNRRSVGPWSGSGVGPEKGRFIYKAIDANDREIAREIERALDTALRRLDL